MTKNGWCVSVTWARRINPEHATNLQFIYSDLFPVWQVDKSNGEAPGFYKLQQFIS